MISFKLNGIPTLFIKAFTSVDVEDILEFVRDASAMKSQASDRVLFIDTPITTHTIEAVVKLKKKDIKFIFEIITV